jgi:hypothetical protein
MFDPAEKDLRTVIQLPVFAQLKQALSNRSQPESKRADAG